MTRVFLAKDNFPSRGTKNSFSSVGLVSSLAIVQLGLVFVFQCVLLARWYAASEEMDALAAALLVPQFVSSLLGGALQYTLIPLIVKERVDGKSDQELAGIVGLVLVGFLFGFCFLASFYAQYWLGALVAGFGDSTRDLTLRLAKITIWLTLLMTVTSFLQGLLHARNRFRAACLPPLAGIALTLGLAVALRGGEGGIESVAWSMLLGSALTCALLAWLAKQDFRFGTSHPALGTFLVRFLPLVLAACYYKLDPLVDGHLASELGTGSVAHLSYLNRILGALLMISTSGLAIVVFPAFARLSAEMDWPRLGDEVYRASRMLLMVMLPIGVAVICFSRQIIRDFMQAGEFSDRDTEILGQLLVGSLGYLVAASWGEILTKALYAQGRTRLPILIGIVGFTLGMGIKLSLSDQIGLLGIVLINSAYFAGNAVVEWLALGLGFRTSMIKDFVRYLGVSVLAALIGWAALFLPLGRPAILGGILGAITYVGVLFWLRDETFLELIGRSRTERNSNIPVL